MGTEKSKTIIIRPMTELDAKWARALDSNTFPDIWSKEMWKDELSSTIALYLAIEEDEKPIGFAGFWLVAGEAQITKVAVEKEHRGKGLGKALTKALVEEAKKLEALSMNLEVRVSNLGAQKVYTDNGFKNVGIRPKYYQDNQEDAMIMAQDF